MRTRSRNRRRWQSHPEVSLNAFLDLVLNILLFFVFATELAVFDAIEIEVPKAEASEQQEDKSKTLTILISRDNENLVDSIKVSDSELRSAIQERIDGGGIDSVIIRGDLVSDLQSTVSVLSACRGLSIDKVKIETQTIGKPQP